VISPKSERELQRRFEEIFDPKLRVVRIKSYWAELGVDKVVC